jgi:hypothetical protein
MLINKWGHMGHVIHLHEIGDEYVPYIYPPGDVHNKLPGAPATPKAAGQRAAQVSAENFIDERLAKRRPR